MKNIHSLIRWCALSLVLVLTACGGGSGGSDDGGGANSSAASSTSSTNTSVSSTDSSASSSENSTSGNNSSSVAESSASNSLASSASSTTQSSVESTSSSTASSVIAIPDTSSSSSAENSSNSSTANSSAESSVNNSEESSSSSNADSSISSSEENNSSSSEASSASSNEASSVNSSASSSDESSSSSDSESSSSSVESSSSSSSSEPSEDTTPDAFTFTAQLDVTPGVFATSEAITIAGINAPTTIEIIGGEYAIDDGLFTDVEGQITDGQTVRVRVLAAITGLTKTTATLFIGGIDSDFEVTTQVDITPDTFAFDAQIDVAFGALVESNSVTISGLDEAAVISITGGEYSIDGAGFTPEDSLIEAGQSVRLRLTAANTFGTTNTATLVVGDTSVDFTVTTIRDTLAPSAKVLFPFPVSMTTSTTLTVRGEAQDAENTPITAVTVDGVSATSNDGFATWQAQVPLSVGKRLLKVRTEDADGNSDPDAATITLSLGTAIENFQRVRGIEFDAENNRALVVDETLKVLVSVDLDTRGRIIISGATTGEGPAFSKPTSVAIDRANNRALVTDIGRKAIIAVDLTTGNRSTFSDSPLCFSSIKDKVPLAVAIDSANNRALAIDCFGISFGVAAIDLTTGERTQLDTGGKRIDNLTSIAVDNLNNRALLGDFGQIFIAGGVEQHSPRIIAVDFATGQRTVLSGKDGNSFVGGGDNDFDNPVSVSMDEDNNRVIVLDADINGVGAVFGVDLTTGFRKVLSGPRSGGGTTGSGDSFGDAVAVSLNSVNGNALVVSTSSDLITSVSLTNGFRTSITSASNTRLLESPTDLALDSTNQRVFTVDDFRKRTLAIDLRNAQTSIVSINGTDPRSIEFSLPLDVAFDSGKNRLLVSDPFEGLLAIDLASNSITNNRSIVSGSGPTLASPFSVAIDSDSNLAYVGNSNLSNARLFVVNLSTGNRTLVSDNSKGTGPALRAVTDVIVDKDNNRLIAINGRITDEFIFTVDLATGNRTILSGADVGEGIAFGIPTKLTLDAANNRVLVTDFSAKAVIAVDLTTGNRTEFSGPNTGTGPTLINPNGIVLTENNIALIIDAGVKQLFALDMITGERVMIGR